MLFNSWEFIFLFLPLTLFIFFQIGRRGYYTFAIAWLVAASLFFYAWWNPAYLISGVSLERLRLGFLAKLKTPEPGNANYKSENINNYGDETSNIASKMQKSQLRQIAKIQPMEIINGYIKSSYGMKVIRDFVDWCRQNNIQVLATWPNTIWFEAYRGHSQQEFFQSIEDFYNRIKVPILGKPQDFMYDKSMIYDIDYQLNARGVHQRTKQLLDLLQPYLENMHKKYK